MDEQMRALERTKDLSPEDKAAWYWNCIQAGAKTDASIRLAAYCDDPGARLVKPHLERGLLGFFCGLYDHGGPKVMLLGMSVCLHQAAFTLNRPDLLPIAMEVMAYGDACLDTNESKSEIVARLQPTLQSVMMHFAASLKPSPELMDKLEVECVAAMKRALIRWVDAGCGPFSIQAG